MRLDPSDRASWVWPHALEVAAQNSVCVIREHKRPRSGAWHIRRCCTAHRAGRTMRSNREQPHRNALLPHRLAEQPASKIFRPPVVLSSEPLVFLSFFHDSFPRSWHRPHCYYATAEQKFDHILINSSLRCRVNKREGIGGLSVRRIRTWSTARPRRTQPNRGTRQSPRDCGNAHNGLTLCGVSICFPAGTRAAAEA